MTNKTLRLLLVDDHQIVIDGIKSLLEHQGDFDIHEANNGREALNYVVGHATDLVLMDVDMPIMNGMEALTQMKLQKPGTKVIILSMHGELALIKKLLAIGADGYLLKNCSQEELLTAVDVVMDGEQFLSDTVRTAIESKKDASQNPYSQHIQTELLAELTEREIEIIKLLADGMTNKEIGDQLFISHRTVDTHRTNLMKKLNVTNVAGIIKFAYKNGLTGED